MTSVDRDLGRVEGKVDAQSEHLKDIADKLDRILTGECMTGKANRGDIEKLDTRVKKVEFTLAKAITAGLIVAGGTTGVAKVLETIF